jgi:hypothetical protein
MNFYYIFLLLLVVLSAYSESPQPPDPLVCPNSSSDSLGVLAPVLSQNEMSSSVLSQNMILPQNEVYRTTVYWHCFSHSITFHTNRKSPSVLPGSPQRIFYNMVYSSSTCDQSLKLLQSFDEAGDFQEWCEKCRFAWSNFCTESATF